MKFLKYYILVALFGFGLSACEIDNYDAPDGTIQGAITDHEGNPFIAGHGAEIIRMREISWAKDESTYIANRKLKVLENGTYRNTKIFKGTYLIMPHGGAFYPYWSAADGDQFGERDDAGEQIEIKNKSTTTINFTVTPYLTLEWVKKPTIDSEGYVSCSVRFRRNQKVGYDMPDLREANMSISRTINAGAGDGSLVGAPLRISNDQEGTEIEFKSLTPLKYHGINYWIRVSMNTQSVSGNSGTNYPGIGASNYTTTEQVFYP